MDLSAGPWLLLIWLSSLLSGCAQGKVLRGEVSSRIAWESKGVFLAKFGFHGEFGEAFDHSLVRWSLVIIVN